MKDEPMINDRGQWTVEPDFELIKDGCRLVVHKPNGGRLVFSKRATDDLRNLLNKSPVVPPYHWLGAEAE